MEKNMPKSLIKISTLEEYTTEIKKIETKVDNENKILYRGQSDSSWGITSSLERFGIAELACEEYYKIIDKYKPLLNPIVERKLERKTNSSGYPFNFDKYEEASWQLPEMEYLTYLRHHGFPTPLIDWSRSLYVALFFACEDNNLDKDGKVFVYVPPKVKFGGTNVPELRHVGRYVETDQRHLAQQSEYLFPVKYTDKWGFISYKDVPQNEHYHTVFSIEIEKKSKINIMNDLNKMNINRYTIYLDEDSLIKSFKDEWAQEIKQ